MAKRRSSKRGRGRGRGSHLKGGKNEDSIQISIGGKDTGDMQIPVRGEDKLQDENITDINKIQIPVGGEDEGRNENEMDIEMQKPVGGEDEGRNENEIGIDKMQIPVGGEDEGRNENEVDIDKIQMAVGLEDEMQNEYEMDIDKIPEADDSHNTGDDGPCIIAVYSVENKNDNKATESSGDTVASVKNENENIETSEELLNLNYDAAVSGFIKKYGKGSTTDTEGNTSNLDVENTMRDVSSLVPCTSYPATVENDDKSEIQVTHVIPSNSDFVAPLTVASCFENVTSSSNTFDEVNNNDSEKIAKSITSVEDAAKNGEVQNPGPAPTAAVGVNDGVSTGDMEIIGLIPIPLNCGTVSAAPDPVEIKDNTIVSSTIPVVEFFFEDIKPGTADTKEASLTATNAPFYNAELASKIGTVAVANIDSPIMTVTFQISGGLYEPLSPNTVKMESIPYIQSIGNLATELTVSELLEELQEHLISVPTFGLWKATAFVEKLRKTYENYYSMTNDGTQEKELLKTLMFTKGTDRFCDVANYRSLSTFIAELESGKCLRNVEGDNPINIQDDLSDLKMILQVCADYFLTTKRFIYVRERQILAFQDHHYTTVSNDVNQETA